jgi:hypothetical protein
MAEGKKSFIAYTDWKDTFDALPDEKAGQLIKFIYAYVNDENPKTEDVLINAVFANIKNTLKRDLKKWDKQHQQRKEAGKRSAEVRKQNATLVNARSISSTVSVSVSDNDSDIINNIYDKFVDEVKEGLHTQAINMMYMRLKIKDGSLTPLLKSFKGQLIIDQTIHKNTLEFRKHFNNWLNTQERVGKLNEYKTNKTL